jgi:SAM-dependent methyltransferase
MEESLKLLETDSKDAKLIYPKHCPVCGVDTTFVHRIKEGKDGDSADWYECQCGVIFQGDFKNDSSIYDEKYMTDLVDMKEAKQRYGHLVRTYGQLIEELTFGRMLLEVGFSSPYIFKEFEERGWITWAIDINPALTGKGNIYKGDYLGYDFSISSDSIKAATGEDKIYRKFDLIWMGHVLEHFADPIAALKRTYDLLDPKGVVFISTPDIDFINKTGTCGFPHFKCKEHNVLWSERSLKRELERLGFKIVVCRRNFSSRYPSWYDLHVIAQKEYF